MIERVSNNPTSQSAKASSSLKPRQVRVTTNVDIGLEYLRELFSSTADPVVRIQGCDECNQGGCIWCIRGFVALGTKSPDSIEFDRGALEIVSETEVPIRLTYETVYEEVPSEPGGEASPAARQVFIEMDPRLEPFTKNELEEQETLKRTTVFKVLS